MKGCWSHAQIDLAAQVAIRKPKPRKTWRDGEAEAAKWRERIKNGKVFSTKNN